MLSVGRAVLVNMSARAEGRWRFLLVVRRIKNREMNDEEEKLSSASRDV